MCDHLNVTRGVLDDAPIWTCTDCAEQFVPTSESMADLEEYENTTVDLMTAVFSSILWDLHLRARAENPDIEPSAPEDIHADALKAICEQRGHDYSHGGSCRRCGHNPYLGQERP